MLVGKTYRRTTPSGDTTLVTIKSYAEKEYQEDLEKNGCVFIEVETPPGVCISCEA